MWPATLTVLPNINRLNCIHICKQIETHWNYSWNIWLWKGLDKRTSRRKLKQTFSPDQTRKTLFKTKKLRHSRPKEKEKKKTLATFKTGGRNFKASLSFGWESSCPDNLCAWSSKSKTGEQKKTSETWWQLAWNEDWHCAQCSWKGASANRFS